MITFDSVLQNGRPTVFRRRDGVLVLFQRCLTQRLGEGRLYLEVVDIIRVCHHANVLVGRPLRRNNYDGVEAPGRETFPYKVLGRQTIYRGREMYVRPRDVVSFGELLREGNVVAGYVIHRPRCSALVLQNGPASYVVRGLHTVQAYNAALANRLLSGRNDAF